MTEDAQKRIVELEAERTKIDVRYKKAKDVLDKSSERLAEIRKHIDGLLALIEKDKRRGIKD